MCFKTLLDGINNIIPKVKSIHVFILALLWFPCKSHPNNVFPGIFMISPDMRHSFLFSSSTVLRFSIQSESTGPSNINHFRSRHKRASDSIGAWKVYGVIETFNDWNSKIVPLNPFASWIFCYSYIYSYIYAAYHTLGRHVGKIP